MLCDLHDRHGKTHAHVVVEAHLDVVNTKRFDFYPSEKMDIGRASVDLPQIKLDCGLGHHRILRIEDARILPERTNAAAPPRPKAKLEETHRYFRRGNRADHADQSLGAADLRAHVLAEHC